jgi:hypothetical protein
MQRERPHPQNDASCEELLADWRQLARRVDAFFDAAQQRQPGSFACRAGCTACCQQDLSVMFVEAVAIAEALAQLPAAQREAIAADAARSGPPCAFLGEDGLCRVYDARPLVCRSHGLPIRQRSLAPARAPTPDRASVPDQAPGTDGAADDAPGEQEELSVCELNFTDGVIESATVLDGATVVATLTVVDQLARRRAGDMQPRRIPLRELARLGSGALARPV